MGGGALGVVPGTRRPDTPLAAAPRRRIRAFVPRAYGPSSINAATSGRIGARVPVSALQIPRPLSETMREGCASLGTERAEGGTAAALVPSQFPTSPRLQQSIQILDQRLA